MIEIIITLITALLGTLGIKKIFNKGIESVQNDLKKKELEDSIIESENFRKRNQSFNNLSDGAKSDRLFKLLAARAARAESKSD